MNAADGEPAERRIGRIPVRNLWLLLLYASDLVRTGKLSGVVTDEQIDDLPDLVATLLAQAVDKRFRRNLTRGYRYRERALTRVRGRIDVLRTESRRLLDRGEVFCRFEEHTIDTPRNRFVRAAIERVARLVQRVELARQCRSLALSLARQGVSGLPPSRSELTQDQIGRNDTLERNMVALAELAFDMTLPTEEAGSRALSEPDREEVWVRRLFERAVLGFARVELEPLGWRVRGGVQLHWQVSSESRGASAILPRMVTDILLDAPDGSHRTVIDTKFTSILAKGRFGSEGLKSNYLYQMYAYIRSQEELDCSWGHSSGLFVHPAIDFDLYESVTIQGHSIRFATVNLNRRPMEVRSEFRRILHAGCGY